MEIIKDIQEAEKVYNLEAVQKAKIKWAIEGDENKKFYHGNLNKKRNQLGIRGVLKDGMWIDNHGMRLSTKWIGRAGNVGYTSIWCDIIKEMDRLASYGIDL
nr:RNA-directed DNA polymerase, eukaryota [Tanacetum cinerariifolium]